MYTFGSQLSSARGKFLAGAAITGILLLTGCAETTETPHAASNPFVHVHGLAAESGSTEIFVATHTGIYSVAENGDVLGPIGGNGFDAMGFAISDEAWFASGHPGPETPGELGSPHLGIVRSDDQGQTWAPVTFTGIEDFHILEVNPSGALFGIGSSSPAVRVSVDGGNTWDNRAEVFAADIAVTAERVYAATEQGVLVSADEARTFETLEGAPLLYTLAAQPDGSLLGIDTDSAIWSLNAGSTWNVIGSAQGVVRGLTTTADGAVLLADDRGIVRVDASGSTIVWSVK